MNPRLAMALILTLLIGMLSVVFNVQRVKTSGTIYIRADGSIDPPMAAITTVDNITYIVTGNITSDADGIVIERNNTIVDGAGCRLQGREVWGVNGISLFGISNVTIKNMEIIAFGDGISLAQASDNTISGNNITDNMLGIRLSELSEHNNITGNNINENSWYGIILYSSHNIISENTFVNDGLFVGGSYGNLVKDNLVNGKPLVFLEGASDFNVENAGQVVLVNCSSIRVENLDLSNSTVGVELWGTHNSEILGNNISGQRLNYWGGITLYDSSNNSIVGNSITNNQEGINFHASSNNNISGNNIKANSDFGIRYDSGSNNTIVGNNITNNRIGIWLSESSNNRIVGNNILDNGYAEIPMYEGYGIALVYSSSSLIYHNNFVNNSRQVDTDDLFTNIWDNGYPSGGNYWNDYTGVDVKSDSYQNETGSDGIGDMAYAIDANNRDNYPLAGVFSDFNATGTFKVQTICNSTVSDFYYNSTAISFKVTAENGTNGFCRICIPTILVHDDYKVYVNGTQVMHTLLPCSNSTHSYLYFTYNHSIQEVVIVPEFTSFLFMPLFMIATLLATTFYKRKYPVKLHPSQ